MKVLIVGNGGREHALAWSLAKNTDIIGTPANPGIAKHGKCFNVAMDNIDGLVNLAQNEKVDLVVVGPELPLILGLVDKMKEKGIPAFGPNKMAARIEGSKKFAKDLMEKYAIPTAAYETFTDFSLARNYLEKNGAPIVIKANGLAAGKGAVVCMTLQEALETAESMLVKGVFGEAGKEIVVEEYMEGEETSILALTDGKAICMLPPSQDHKRVFDNDKGPNTGGMGAYAPALCVNPKLLKEIEKKILRPTLLAMENEGCPYTGVLYAGLMLTKSGPKVVEFNCRFGDPETQAVLPLIKNNLAELLLACVTGGLGEIKLRISKGAAVCVVVASQGYPGSYEKGKEICGMDYKDKNSVCFQAGTKTENGKILTSGGRVLGVTGMGKSLPKAIQNAYHAVAQKYFDGMQFRKDIGTKGLKCVVKGKTKPKQIKPKRKTGKRK